MKKLLLSLGALTSVVAPVAAVVSCGSDSSGPQTINFDTNRDSEWHDTFRDGRSFVENDIISLNGSAQVKLTAEQAKSINDARSAMNWPGFINAILNITHANATDAEKEDIRNKFMSKIRSEKDHSKFNATGLR